MDWSKRFNALPKETRIIACAVSFQQKIRDLERDKKMLKAEYNKRAVALDNLIGSLQTNLNKLPPPPEGAPDG